MKRRTTAAVINIKINPLDKAAKANPLLTQQF